MNSRRPDDAAFPGAIPPEFAPAAGQPEAASFAPPPLLSSLSAETLRREVRNVAGLIAVTVEERVHPLWLRAGTADVEQAIAALDPARRGLKIAHEPRRILEIGAGAGYRSVALAADYPGADILATEADPGFQRAALLNTLPYANITYLPTALAPAEARYGFFGRKGAQGLPALMEHPAGNIRAQPLAHLLHSRRFHNVDTLIITPDAASEPLLRAPLPASLRLIAVETGGAPLLPSIAQHYRLAEFLTMISGDYVLLYRRGVARVRAEPRSLNVFMPDGALQALRLENVAPDGFFPIGGGGFRLHPNEDGAPPARVTISTEIEDHAELHVSMRSVLDAAAPVRFTVKMLAEGGALLASGSEIVPGGAARGMVIPLPELQGPCELVFTTEMAEPGAANHGVWAEFISVTLI